MAGFRIKLNHSNAAIQNIINRAAVKKLSSQFYKFQNLERIRKIVAIFVKEAIVNTDTWKSLLSDSDKGLHAHVGLPVASKQDRLNKILNMWAKEIEVRPRKVSHTGKYFTIGYDFYAIEVNFGNVLSSPEAIVENFSKKSNKGETPKYIPWLHWLLIAGDQVQINDYHIKFGSYDLNRSRSGKAIMVVNGHYVLPTFFGPYGKDNNFVCRAMDEIVRNNDFKQRLIATLSDKTGLLDVLLLFEDT